MEIITANMSQVMSATSFWPGALANYIGSYQASFAADARAWSAGAPVTAEPSPPPFQGFQAEPALHDTPIDPLGSGDLPVPTDVAVSHDERNEPPTITAHVATPQPPGYDPTPPPRPESPAPQPTLAPAGYEPTRRQPRPSRPGAGHPTAPVTPLPVDQPPAPKPSRPLLRPAAVVMGAVVLLAGAVGVAFALAGSHSTSTPQGGGGGHTISQPPGGFGLIPVESGTPHAGTVSFGVPSGSGPEWNPARRDRRGQLRLQRQLLRLSDVAPAVLDEQRGIADDQPGAEAWPSRPCSPTATRP